MKLPPLTPENRKHVQWMARTYTAAQLAEAVMRDPLASRVYLIVNDVRQANDRKRLPAMKTRVVSIRKQLDRRRLSEKRVRALIREVVTLEGKIRMLEGPPAK